MTVEDWWESVNHSEMWSGAWVRMSWSDLPDEVKEEIALIFNKARNSHE